ncbi:hypothetical protein CBR_g46601 [Chara braunii]|uniref:Uncharacterized protein n=1 Tax=Chara braunii TaxID=69332 RepID=A0A388M0V0_CHABU|nr:hypothetical protein CBR_g46601 [Chara braunii]|eukprot:GBG88112.1 hypothetical protein CBR_g46601 [Chara braunii]
MVAAGHQLSLPLVPFDAPVESLAGLSTCSSDRRQVVSTPQQPAGGKQKVITYQRRSGGSPSGNLPKTKRLARPPSDLPGSSCSGAISRSRDTAQRGMGEELDEETGEDERVHQLQSRLLATPQHIQGEGSYDVNVGREGGGGAEAQKSDDSSDDAEGVAPRLLSLPDDDEQETKKPSAVNMTQCFLLEYDDDDKKRRDPPRVVIDVVQILPIPVGDITFNQRSLNLAIFAGIDAAIEASNRPRSADDPAPWDPPELLLAPIMPSLEHPDNQGTQVLPQDFDSDRADEYFYYPVAGQHTSEAMKRAVERKFEAVEVFGFRNYDRVRIIYFDDDHTNKMRGYVNVATCKDGIWPLVKEFFQKFEAGELPLHDNKCPKDLPGKQEERLSGQFTEEVQGKKEVFHCIAARDGGPNAMVSFKDLVPSNFKCFGDMTAREKKIALRLMIDKKVIATTRLVPPGKLNMTNLLDIIMRERYMMRMFNYIVFKSENREAKEWKDGNFFDYENVEERFGVKAGEWDEERDRIPLEYVRRVLKRLGGEQEEKNLKGAGPKATEALYRDARFHFKYFVYHAIGKVDLRTTELRRLKNAALHLCWEKKGRRSTLLPVNMHPKELLLAADKIVTAATNLNCKAAILDLANPKDCLAWSPTDFDALHKMMSKLCGKVIPGTWKRYLVGTAGSKYGNLQADYKDTMVVVLHAEGGDLRKVTRIPKLEAELVELHVEEEKFKRCTTKHGGDEGNEREEYGRWERHPTRMHKLCSSFLHEDQGVLLIGKPHAGLVWELLRAGYHAFACDGSSKDISYLTTVIDILGKDARNDCTVESVPIENREEGRTKSGGASSPTRDVTDRASSIEQMQTDSPTPLQALENALIHGNRHGLHGRHRTLRGNTEHNMMADDDEDDLAVPYALPRLMLGDDIPDHIVQASEQPYFIEDKVPKTTSEKWGHHILWHTDVFEPCIFKGEWMMVLHLTSGWKVKARLAEVPWMKVTKSEIVFRVKCENDGADEAAIEEKAQLLFHSLHASNQLEYKHKFYDLPSSRSYKTIDWKIELPACQGIETIQLGCSQLGGQSATHFAASVGEAMSQTNVKIMGVDKGTRNVDKDPSNVAPYEPPLLTQAENQSASQMERPTPSTNMAVSDQMQQGGYAEHASEVQKDSDEMMKQLDEAEKYGKRNLRDQPHPRRRVIVYR